MSTQAIILVLISACLHSAWNLFSKSSGDPISFLLRALGFSAVVYAPLFAWMQLNANYTPQTAGLLLGSGMLTGLYFFCLSKAYHHGQVSIAYPIARAFPILVVMFGGLFLREFPSLQGLVGVVCIVGGCFVLPWRRFVLGPEGFCPAHYRNRSVAWAVAAALCTAGFSLLDKVAASVMAEAEGFTFWDKVNYVYLQNFIAWLTAMACIKAVRYPIIRVARKRAFACGVIFLLSYTLILMALATDPVAYVVSFRQLSIVLATLVAMWWIERDFTWPRFCGVTAIFIGVVLIGLA